MASLLKICGLTRAQDAIDAAELGATHLGFVFFPKSPRFIDPAAAEEIVTELKHTAFEKGFEAPAIVGLFVDAGEKQLSEASPFLTHFQFHGRESPDRCAAMREEFGLDVIKAIGVGSSEDVTTAAAFVGAADYLLFDARPPKGAERPGGHGAPFNWSLIAGYIAATPFFVAGGLDDFTVSRAIGAARSNPAFIGVDVSSGVEETPGRKNREKMKGFIASARSAFL